VTPMPSRDQDEHITWIHLSDYHAGQRGTAARARIDEVLERSITQMATRLGLPDLLLFTGDLVFSGKPEEYEQVDALLDRIDAWLGVELPVFAVPGNHDLARPTGADALGYFVLKHYEDEDAKELHEELWQRDSGFLNPLFASYEAWAQRSMVRRIHRAEHELHRSTRVPGDFSAVVQKHDFRLGLVGLNSAWVQIDGGDFFGKLQLPAEQFHAALPSANQPLDWFRRVDAALLLTHHPRSWLSKRALKIYEHDIHPPDRFALALFGHMHTPESLTEARDGTRPRAYFQAPSLFGLEHYGSANESRSFGYAWGRISAGGEVRVWPQTVVSRGGSSVFVDDPTFEQANDALGGAVLASGPAPVQVAKPSAREVRPHDDLEPEIGRYLDAVEQEFRSVRLIGFENKARVLLSLDELFVPLDAVIDRERPGKDHFGGLDERRTGQESISLARAFHRARQLGRRGLVLLGDPGAGKTTQLQQLLLQVARHGSGSIGLPLGVVPVFLPLRDLSGRETTLAEFICDRLRDPTGNRDPEFGRRLTKRGKLLLLLDGLDEVADSSERARVARFIEQARIYMPDSFMVVSCRHAGYRAKDVALGPDFLELHLPPLRDEQVRQFVRKWYAIVERELNQDERLAAQRAEARANDLLEMLAQPEIRAVARVYAMTRNPLLLTAICLVHRDHGRLPNSRAKLYDLCIEVLLERWRVNRDSMSLSADEVLAILQPVAAWMHGQRERTRANQEELLGPVSEALARLRDTSVDAQGFLRLIRDDSGLLTGYGVDEFGFMHLGFQELLTAQHLRNEYVARRGTFDELAGRFGDSWWQEVILLLLAERNPNVFEPFMAALVRQVGFPGWADSAMMQQCWAEAAEPSAVPFMDLLREGDERYVEQQVAAAELLERRMPWVLHDLDLGRHPIASLREWWSTRCGWVVEVRDVIRNEVADIELVRIPGGTFMMGTRDDDEGDEDERPQHEVVLGEFYLARTPVTNAQYARFLAAHPEAQVPEYWGNARYNQPEQPVVGVSWDEAQAYCEWAKLVLPTEAQWEYACRAGTTTSYWSGDGEEELARVGWYGGNSDGRLHVVGEKDANPFGLFDMHGNVSEWCRDNYGPYTALPGQGDGLRHEPVGDATRVVRGGCWFDDAHDVRPAYRLFDYPGYRSSIVGFRPAQATP
jgi:formylglycine-generating enzyme required for sulfatase activity/predicted MPP superfamily phosphohydrolase